MDAVQFIYEARRRYNVTGQVCSVLSVWNAPENIVKELEVWCKEHPTKTRQSEFLEQWPEGEINKDGVLMVCPKLVSTDCRNRYGNCTNRVCSVCRRKFWSQEVE